MKLKQFICRKTLLAALVCAISAGPAVSADLVPVLAPVNPNFITPSTVTLLTSGGRPLGHRSSPIDNSNIAQSAMLEARRTAQGRRGYAATYDLRDYNKVTPVKNQGSCGACWAFGAISSLESTLKPDEEWDFSENNMKNTHGFNWTHCYGGNGDMATAYLARWSGPVNEIDDPYNASSSYSPSGLTVRKHLQEMLKWPSRSRNDIKEAITTVGALDVSMYMSEDPAYYKSATSSFYFTGSASTNHDVTVVGWDDNYDKNNFSAVPAGNGAYLVKNSWGTGWGNSGYFWVSYYDTRFATEIFSFSEAQEPTNYSRVYQYDPYGPTMNLGYGLTSAWMANIFTAADAGQAIKAVAFHTNGTDSTYELRIYTNVTTGDPRSGTLAYSSSGSFPLPGFHTLQVTQTPITQGQKFSVVVKITCSSYNYQIPIEYPISGYSSAATASSGQSYVSASGTDWSDLPTISDFRNSSICIKAYTASPEEIAVTGITPATGITGNSVAVTNLAGSGFKSGATVKLTKSGQSDISATGVTFVSATKLTCTLPLAGAVIGPWNVVVTTDALTATLSNGFTVTYDPPTIASISPATALNTATVAGVQITGTHFRAGVQAKLARSGETDITATNLSVNASSTVITCNLPITGALGGNWDVMVTNTDDGQTAILNGGFAITTPPPNIASVSPSTATNVNSAPLVITGTDFYRGASVKLARSGNSDIAGTSVSLTGNSRLAATFDITGAAAGDWDMVVTNADSQSDTYSSALTIVQAATEAVTASAGGTVNFPYSTTHAELVIPPGAFSSDVTVTMATPNGSQPDPASSAASLLASTLALQITTDPALQPLVPLTLVVGYTAAHVSGLEESRLLVARHDSSRGLWIPLQSSVDAANNTVTAQLDHLSLFKLMQTSASSGMDGVKCYPNPMRPALGSTYAKMNFTGLPSGASLKIYTFAGELARTLDADGSGMAVWDGKNSSGRDMASGVYLVLIESDGSKKIIKAAIER